MTLPAALANRRVLRGARPLLAIAATFGVCSLTPAAASAATFTAGDLDPSFGTGGTVLDTLSAKSSTPADAAVQPDGKIVVAATAVDGKTGFGVARYNADGSPDTTFSGDGEHIVTFPESNAAQAKGIALDSQGRIVVSGTTYVSSSPQWGIARLNADGTPDATFDDDGQKTFRFNADSGGGAGVTVDRAGKIVMVGTAYMGGGFNGFGIVRMLDDGRFDAGFDDNGPFNGGTAGHVSFSVGQNDAHAYDVAVDASGRVVVGGHGSDYDGVHLSRGMAVARRMADGSLDFDFGDLDGETGGAFRVGSAVVRVNEGTDEQPRGSQSEVEDMAVVGNDIILAGSDRSNYGVNPPTKSAVVRLSGVHGDRDGTFGHDGAAIADLSSDGYSVASAIQQDTQGRLLVGTTVGDENGSDTAGIRRLTSTGALDTSFTTSQMTGQARSDGAVAVIPVDSKRAIMVRQTGATIATIAVDRFYTEGHSTDPAEPIKPIEQPPVEQKPVEQTPAAIAPQPQPQVAPAELEPGQIEALEARRKAKEALAKFSAQMKAAAKAAPATVKSKKMLSSNQSLTFKPQTPNTDVRAGFVIAPDTSKLGSQDALRSAANVVAAGGANVVAAGGLNLLGPAAGNLLARPASIAPRAMAAAKAKPVVLSKGAKFFPVPKAGKVRMKPTKAGRAALRKAFAKRGKQTVKVIYMVGFTERGSGLPTVITARQIKVRE